MAKSILFAVAIVIAASIAVAQGNSIREKRQAIPREFQNIKIEDYLKNPRAVQFQLKCVIYDGVCDRIGKYLKIIIPDLLTNRCRNCNPEQRKQAGRLVAFIQQNYPKEWDDAVKKFSGNQKFSSDEVKMFENEFGVKVGDTVSTEPSANADSSQGPTSSTPSTTTARVSLSEVGSIVRNFQQNQEQLSKRN